MTLGKAIKTMRETGADMKDKHKETARGGLALTWRSAEPVRPPEPLTAVIIEWCMRPGPGT
jgi:hypothetical protein